MKCGLVLLLMMFNSCLTKYVISKSIQSGTKDEVNRLLQMLDNIEINMKSSVKSAIKASLPYIMKMAEEVNISSSCTSTIMWFLKDLLQLKEWTIKMLDSFGKLPAGILRMTFWMQGDYDQCLNLRIDKEKNGQSIRAKYCALTLEFPEMRNPEIIEKIVEYKNNSLIRLLHIFSEHIELSNLLKGVNLMNIGPRFDVCIPSTCSKKDIENIGDWAFPELVNLRVDFCKMKDEKVKYSTAQLIWLTVFAFFIVWVIIALLLEIVIQKDFCSKKEIFLDIIFMASPFKSIGKLFSISIKENTRYICGIKVLLIYMIIFIHENILLIEITTLEGNSSVNFQLIGKVFYQIFNQMPIMIETFFFLSGFILVYLRKANNNYYMIHYIMFLIKRTIRLTLPMIFVLAIAIILPLLGDGPHWHYIIQQGQMFERDWWKYILHIHNLYDPEEMHLNILNITWFLSALMQLTVLTVPLLIIRDRWPRIGNIIISILILVGITTHVSDIFIRKYHGIFGKNIIFTMFARYENLHYFKSYYSHMGTYLFGLLIGYFISKNRKMKFGQGTVAFSWTVSVILMVLMIFGIHKYTINIPPNKNVLMIYQCVAPFIWTIALAWVCVACITGYGGIINWFFSLRIFVILDRISMWTYVLHNLIIAYICAEMRRAFTATELNLWMLFSWISILSLIASFFMYVFIESPLNCLVSKCFSKSSPNENFSQKEIPEVQAMPCQNLSEIYRF